MSLQVRNAAGVVTLDISDRITRFQGAYAVSAPGGVWSGFVSVPGMVDDGTWLIVGGLSPNMNMPAYATIGTNGFTWTRYATAFAFSVSFIVLRI